MTRLDAACFRATAAYRRFTLYRTRHCLRIFTVARRWRNHRLLLLYAQRSIAHHSALAAAYRTAFVAVRMTAASWHAPRASCAVCAPCWTRACGCGAHSPPPPPPARIGQLHILVYLLPVHKPVHSAPLPHLQHTHTLTTTPWVTLPHTCHTTPFGCTHLYIARHTVRTHLRSLHCLPVTRLFPVAATVRSHTVHHAATAAHCHATRTHTPPLHLPLPVGPCPTPRLPVPRLR